MPETCFHLQLDMARSITTCDQIAPRCPSALTAKKGVVITDKGAKQVQYPKQSCEADNSRGWAMTFREKCN